MKSAEIRQLTDDELAKTIDENKRELLNLRLQAQTGQLENTGRVRLVRKDIARCRTEQSARASQAK
ncbi:MAG: 50S ribosomal protein L29 [Lentisphaeria bacterium]|nr:50S ribosomal protein L29 [Lentisphaeria bacterium]